jgi:hypothetical protein
MERTYGSVGIQQNRSKKNTDYKKEQSNIRKKSKGLIITVSFKDNFKGIYSIGKKIRGNFRNS